jgi:predicted nucleic acid-binding protein
MDTAVDSSVLWSVFKSEPDAEDWLRVLQRCAGEGALVVCEVVVAEVSPLFESAQILCGRFESLGVTVAPSRLNAWFLAGQTFKSYRANGGPREHMIPDFLIAAHAQTQAQRLAARDRGYLRRYFPQLELVLPAAGSTTP